MRNQRIIRGLILWLATSAEIEYNMMGYFMRCIDYDEDNRKIDIGNHQELAKR